MHYVHRSIFTGAALAALLAGCQNGDAPPTTSNREPSQAVTNAASIPQMPTRDPSLPDATTTFAAQAAADKTKDVQNSAALPQKPATREKMTREEESKAMPLPGQANDHSTTALDKKRK